MTRPLLPALAAAAALALAAAPAARGGEFVVTSCGESPTGQSAGWTLSTSSSTIDTGTQCPPVLAQPGPTSNASKHTGIYLTDKLAAPTDTPAGSAASATFTTAPGTTITRARIWRYYTQFGGGDWRIVGSTLEGTTFDTCAPSMGGCGFGNPNYAPHPTDDGTLVYDLGGLSTSGVRYRLSCEAAVGGACGNGNSLYSASLSLFGAKLTVNDPSAPSQAAPTGGLWSATGYQRGTLSLVGASSDNTGISTTRLLVDEAARVSAPRPCNYSLPIPCSDEPGATLALDTSTVVDGPHAVAVTAVDAAGNERTASRPAQLLVDNNAPSAPMNLRTVDGAVSSEQNSWSLRWELPFDTGSPIVRARYSICPAGTEPSSSCTSGTADGRDITQLPPFALPGPGAWDVRVVLEDELGQSDPTRSAARTLTFQPAQPPPTNSNPAPPPPTQPPSTGPTPPPITGTTTTPIPPPPVVKSSARLKLTRARRSSRSINIRGTTTRLASGPVRVTFSQRIAGRTLRATRTVRLRRGAFAVTLKLSGRLARTRRGALTVAYAGSSRVKAASVRRTLLRP